MRNGSIYVICPAYSKSGGADALHQMVYYLNQISIHATIVYKIDKFNDKPISIPDRYKVYVDSFLLESDIIDSSENTVIITESYTKDRFRYMHAKIFIWWLGINDNLTYNLWKKIFFFTTLPLRMVKNQLYYKGRTRAVIKSVLNKEIYFFDKELPNITHLCASFYAYDYVFQKSHNKVLLCIEPISKQFLNIYKNEIKKSLMQNRSNVILYNPVRKYGNILKKILKKAPELQFEPLQGLTQQQLIEKYKTSKLYIDFGAFPGAERIPKEAVLFGCAIITGKRGASGFHGDVPIPDEYKFGKPAAQINEIVEKIRFVLDNYETIYSDFDEYRDTVLNLEDNFVKSLKEIFLQQN